MTHAITLDDYFGPYRGHPDITQAVRDNAAGYLAALNALLTLAALDGHVFKTDPDTGTLIGGERNGGFRPKDCKVGAPSSKHKTGNGGDIYDPARSFARWCLRNQDQMASLGLYMEDPRWTPTWVHLQNVPPKSGNRVYIPATTPPLAPPLPEQAA